MTNTSDCSSEPWLTLTCEGEFTIYRVAEYQRQWLDSLMQSEALALDLSCVTEMDSAGVQVLMLLQREAQLTQKKLRLVAPSKAVNDLLNLYQLLVFFGDSLNDSAVENATAEVEGQVQ